MGKIKQSSIVKYVADYFLMILIFLAFIMLMFITFLSNKLIHSSIRRELGAELRQNAKNIMYRNNDGSYRLDEDFAFEDEGCIYVILDGEGRLLEGEYPDKFPENIEIKHGKLREIYVDGVEYYIQDRKNLYYPVALRCVIPKSQISSDYDNILSLTWIFAGVVILVSIFLWKILEKRELKQVMQVVKEVGQIGMEKDLSKRIEYDDRFLEISCLAQANNRMLERLEEMFENQRRFTSDVAHELRTPVTVLMAQCEYTKQQLQNGDEVAEAFEVIERQTKRMNHIVIQMLNLSRLDQEKMKLNLEWIDISEMVSSICDDVSTKNEKQVNFKIDIAPDFNVYADIGLMTMLIQNLVDNAVKYGPSQGNIWIWAEEDWDEYLLHIKDEGIGISKENQDLIFERFFRVEKNGLVDGYGLGLSLVKRIAEKHKGSVTVESELGKGSTFTLHLPKNVN